MKDYLYDLFIEEAIPALNRHSGGSGGGGGGALNLHFGEEAPTDTSKMWFKCPEPKNVVISSEIGQLPGVFDTVNTMPGISSNRSQSYAMVGDYVYCFGYNSDPVYKYNVRTNVITAIATAKPDDKVDNNSGVAAVGSKIYIFGGNKSTRIRILDTVTETYEVLDAVLPAWSYYYGMKTAVYGNKIYLLGGNFNSTYGGTTSIYVFDTETNTTTQLSITLPTGLTAMGCATIGANIYLFGGYYYDDSYRNGSISSITRFNVETNTVATLSTTLPTATQNIGTVTIGTKVYLFGGNNGSTYYDRICVFDGETETITTLDTTLPIANYGVAACTNGTNIYLIGGWEDYNIHKLALQTDVPAETLHIIPSIDKNMFDIFEGNSEVQLGVSMALLGNSEGIGEPVEAYLYRDGEWGEIQQNGGYTHKCKEPVLQEKTVTENGEVVPDAGYDGLSKVVVDVKNTGGGNYAVTNYSKSMVVSSRKSLGNTVNGVTSTNVSKNVSFKKGDV